MLMRRAHAKANGLRASSASAPATWRGIGLRPGRTLLLWLIAMASALCAALWWGWLGGLDTQIQDERFKIGTRPASGQFVFVDIDSASLAKIGVWPWPRRVYAQVLDRLVQLGANRVIFDIDFSSSSNEVDDAAFARALHDAGGYAYLAAFVQTKADGGLVYNVPIEQFRREALTVSVNVALNNAGEVRDYPLAMMIGGRITSSTAAVLAPDAALPRNLLLPIDYTIDPATVPRVSAADLLDGVGADAIRGRDVVVGASAIELRDFFVVPRYGVLPGALLQILSAETLLQGRLFTSMGRLFPITMVVLIALATILLLGRMSTARLAIVALALINLTEIVSGIAQANLGVLVDTIGIDLALLLTIVASLIYELLRRGEEKREAEAHVRYLAHHDPLTGALTRYRFAEIVAERLCAGEQLAVVAVDLRRLRTINDTLGHEYGDVILRDACARLSAGEGTVVGRLGAGSFIVMAAEPADGSAAFAARLNALASQPYDLGEHQATISSAAGATSSRISGRDPERLLAHADMALSIAKRRRLETVEMFDQSLDTQLVERAELDRRLRIAVVEKAVQLAYQPQVDLSNGHITGAEALARWTDATLGVVSPGLFIPAAEETGLIVQLGRQALLDACRCAATWPQEMRIAVNVSPIQFQLADVVETVRHALAQSGLSPHRLDIEITEGVFLADFEVVVQKLAAIRDIGVGVALDDFGTGYSSLSYLGALPIDKIKIDQSFVRRIGSSAEVGAIVRAIVAMSRSISVSLVAEGIETATIANWLHQEGCHYGQGYLFGKPMPPEQFAQLLGKPPAKTRDPVAATLLAS